MTEDLVIDVTSPVLDLSYQQLATVDIDYDVPSTRALCISGNLFSDWSFVARFYNLEILYGDACGLTEFARLDLRGLLKLKHLVLRINELRDFQDLPQMESLVNLDVSMNEFRANAEDTLTSPLPELQRL